MTMDREILFRGKTIADDRWVYGDYCQSDFTDDTIHINDGLSSGLHRVIDPKTVGQYTGLKDKNGVKIFEGDIVRAESSAKTVIGVVEYIAWHGAWMITPTKGSPTPHAINLMAHGRTKDRIYTVVGNIYDNPELLEE